MSAQHSHSHQHPSPKQELISSLFSGLLLVTGFVSHHVFHADTYFVLSFYWLVYAVAGIPIAREMLHNLRHKRLEVDSLMLLAALGAAYLGAWGEGALLLFLFSLGHALEHYAMGRAKNAIEALSHLSPDTAWLRRGTEVVEVPVSELTIGDIILIKPNERMPADGFVIQGNSSVNQAAITGESMPVDKQAVADKALARQHPNNIAAASRIYAGTINGSGSLEAEVNQLAKDSTLARIARTVSETNINQSPSQRFAQQFERIFVPAILLLVIALMFAFLLIDESFHQSFYRAMAVLVAASPCALAIATPSAVLSGIARAARSGILIKSGAALETLGTLNAMAFDKTGTLTEGKPQITDILCVNNINEEELLQVAIAVESLSDHPLAAAICRDGGQRLKTPVSQQAHSLKNLVGLGLSAQLNGETVYIGKAGLFEQANMRPLQEETRQAVQQLSEKGRTLMIIRRGEQDLGVIGLMDKAHATTAPSLQKLRTLGISQQIMLSGDNQTVAQAIADELQLDQAFGDLMPNDKADKIKQLSQQNPIAMVGDGVNDAPAMTHAAVGIAMGATGSDIALETADIALMSQHLQQLPLAVALSRYTRKIIKQNLLISLGMVAILVPATIFGLGIGAAVALHEGSTLVVVINALRLLAYKDKA